MAAPRFAHHVVALEPEPEPRPVRPPAPVAAPRFAHHVVALEPEPEPRPVRVSGLYTINKKLNELREQRNAARIRQQQALTQGELQAARDHLSRRQPTRSDGHTLRGAADSIARQRLTADVSLPEFHPQRYAGRPDLPEAVSLLAPRAAPGSHDDRSGPIPDSSNTGACRTQAGAKRAAKVLDEAIDGIAREHFKGHTDPRDYKPGWLGLSIEKAKDAALTAWRSIRESVIERMVREAAEPEALEIRRRREEERKTKERLNLEAEERKLRERPDQPAPVPTRRRRSKRDRGPGVGD